MAANLISQVTAANTFQQWLGATQQLIGTSNALTNGNGSSFYANTQLIIGGSGNNVSLNVETSATINDLNTNTANVVEATFRDVDVTGNIVYVSVTTDLNVGANTYINDELFVGGDTLISGNLTVTGNLNLDEIGFNDLNVSGSADIANTLNVDGSTTIGGNTTIDGNLEVQGSVVLSGSANIASANIVTLVGTANSNIYAAIAAADASALAYSIALG
jgi:hypothetical protein